MTQQHDTGKSKELHFVRLASHLARPTTQLTAQNKGNFSWKGHKIGHSGSHLLPKDQQCDQRGSGEDPFR
jgi:hypothetical protein